jgi:two-component system NtrC family sensor kinase
MITIINRLRYHLIFGFLLVVAGSVVFIGLSYRYSMRIEQKLRFLNWSDSLLNSVLEVRRYEKNYFLYHQEPDYLEALKFLDDFERVLRDREDEVPESLDASFWPALLTLAEDYREALNQVRILARERGTEDSPPETDMREMRMVGQELISKAELLTDTARKKIQELLHYYRILFAFFFLSSISLIGGAVYFLNSKIVKPLHTVEETTQKIAGGEFKLIPERNTRNEIGSLIAAFNRMVIQLQRNREQMIQSEKLSSLGTLTSGVAHELNNPLSNISTSCQILLEELDPHLEDYHKELLEGVEQQVVKARDIVRALLEFARQKDFEPRPVFVREVIEDTLKLIKGEIPSNVEVRQEVESGVMLDLDKARIEQALLNLIINALQAMETGGLLRIRSFSNEETKTVDIEITDTGKGIPPDILPRIFDPFFTTKDVGKGTGLGLSVTYGIIERMGGKIAVHSKMGRGTTFTISFPSREFDRR